MKEEIEGYIIRTIPEQKFKVCSGCKHYSHVLVKSGRYPLYKNDCNHPLAPRVEFVNGNLIDDYAPNWCPVGPRKNEEINFTELTVNAFKTGFNGPELKPLKINSTDEVIDLVGRCLIRELLTDYDNYLSIKRHKGEEATHTDFMDKYGNNTKSLKNN